MTKIDEILEELQTEIMDANSKIFYDHKEKETILVLYKQAMSAIFANDQANTIKTFIVLANTKLLQYIPHTIIFNEITFIKNKMANEVLLQKDATKLYDLFELFRLVENKIAEIFLSAYTKELKNKNELRIKAIEIFEEKRVIKYYEHHLIWLNQLADAISPLSGEFFPEIDPMICEFGQWLDCDAKLNLINKQQYQNLCDAHNKLHLFSSRIKSLIASKNEIEYMLILSMLLKCEYLSIDIGIELSFIKSSEYMQNAQYDALTNVLNRHYLNDIYENEFKLSKLTGKIFCIAMCDLDHFKDINDTYGHDSGDIVLKSFANNLKSSLRGTDFIIRYGGEEFIIIFPATTLENGVRYLERFRQNLEHLDIKVQDENIHITSSFGIVEIDPNNADKYKFDIESSIHKVDQKLYLAKKNGRNRIEF